MQPDPLFIANAKLEEAIKQRDGALERCLEYSAQKMLAGRRILELEAQVTDLQQQIETLKSPIPMDNPAPQESA